MATYIVRRLILALIVLIIITLMIFLVIRLLPGDPIYLYMSRQEQQTLTEEQIDAARHQFGLDKPIVVQYFDWIDGIFHGNFGDSLFYSESVAALLKRRIPVTLNLGIPAFIIGSILGLTARQGVGLRDGNPFVFGHRRPYFLARHNLNIHFRIKSTYASHVWIHLTDKGLGRQYKTPDFTGGLPGGNAARLYRETIAVKHAGGSPAGLYQDCLGQRFKRTQRRILGGSVFIETVFSIPGMGSLSVQALLSKDYAIIQAITLLIASMIVIVNLLVDLTYGWLDPRIRYS